MQLRDLLTDIPVSQDAVVPLAIKQLMRESLNIADDWQRAETLLLKAQAELPEELELQVALYKLYAYSNRFEESLSFINSVLETAAKIVGFENDWRTLKADSADWQPATGATRLYLYSLKAAGFVNLRKGNIDLALEVLTKLQELDPLDQVGGSVVYEMAMRIVEDE
ncbi:hypothetical protein [Aurantivibrio plasticivorans]